MNFVNEIRSVNDILSRKRDEISPNETGLAKRQF